MKASLEKPDAFEVFQNGTAVGRALRLAVRDALLRHELPGESVVVWRDGKVVEVPPDEIVVDPPPRRRTVGRRRSSRRKEPRG